MIRPSAAGMSSLAKPAKHHSSKERLSMSAAAGSAFADLLPPESLRVAAIQLNSGSDKASNVERALALIDRAAADGARLVALPEVWTYLGPDEGNRAQAEPIPGPTIDRLADRARR